MRREWRKEDNSKGESDTHEACCALLMMIGCVFAWLFCVFFCLKPRDAGSSFFIPGTRSLSWPKGNRCVVQKAKEVSSGAPESWLI